MGINRKLTYQLFRNTENNYIGLLLNSCNIGIISFPKILSWNISAETYLICLVHKWSVLSLIGPQGRSWSSWNNDYWTDFLTKTLSPALEKIFGIILIIIFCEFRERFLVKGFLTDLLKDNETMKSLRRNSFAYL